MTVKLNRKTDAELIRMLEEVPSKQGLIREALRGLLHGDYVGTKS